MNSTHVTLGIVLAVAGFALGVVATRLWWSGDELRPTVQPERAAAPVMAGERAASTPLTQPGPGFADPTDELARLSGLVEQVLVRLDAIEGKLGRASSEGIRPRRAQRRPTTNLREVVADVLAEAAARDERLQEERRAEAKRLDEEHYEAEMRFQIGVATAEMGRELDLLPAQRDELTEALIALEIARRDMQRALDPMTSDPETWEARFQGLEDEFWARLDQTLGPELTAKLREYL